MGVELEDLSFTIEPDQEQKGCWRISLNIEMPSGILITYLNEAPLSKDRALLMTAAIMTYADQLGTEALIEKVKKGGWTSMKGSAAVYDTVFVKSLPRRPA